MKELEPSLPRVLRIWWLYSWRVGIGTTIIGLALGFVGLLVNTLTGASKDTIQLCNAIVGFPLMFVWMIIVLRMALRKRYEGFRIALVSDSEPRAD